MQDWKSLFGFCAILLTIIGYFPYIRDVLAEKTKPHIYSWILFAFITLIAFALQFEGEAGLGSFATLASTILILIVVVLSLIKGSHKDVTMLDTLFVVLTLISLVLWLMAEQPVLSAILITTTDLLAYGPTIRKAWHKPFTETPSFFLCNVVRFLFVLASVQTYSIMTALYPMAEALMMTFLVLMLFIRRRVLSNNDIQNQTLLLR